MNISSIIVCISILVIGILIFVFYYNSPMFSENICRIEKQTEGFPCRTVLDQLSYAHTEVFIDSNWINICNSKMEHYCTAVN